eukprot:Phypoly_transcript_05874.p1 GENE.Phypoly_transcript_05874~~Phypoly_transcript_05874.p1  ORF type:complete len:433 (+),score=60.72 Phypoly_transcript_05874:536-1834(+)
MVWFIISLLLLVSARAYDIDAIKTALSVDFNVEQGEIQLFNVSKCLHLPSCFGNNPESPYVLYYFPSWSGTSGPLRPDEAILVIQARPPTCRYFGYTPYLFSRTTGRIPTFLFASLSDTLNMDVVNISADGTIAFVSSPNPHVTATVENTIAPYLQPKAINTLSLPGQLLNLGLDSTADQIGYLARYALFADQAQGIKYLNDIPGYALKLTPKVSDNSVLYPYPTYRPLGPVSDNEDYLQSTLDALVDAVKASEHGIALVQTGTDIEEVNGYVNGFTCINGSLNCNGDNRDARYLKSESLYIYNTSSSHTWVVGVQHQKTGKATYTAVAGYYSAKKLGVISVADVKMNGSAEIFLPNNQYSSLLYAIKFARSCGPTEKYCFVVPVNFPGVPLDEAMDFTERVYVEPGFKVEPAAGSILSPQFIRYHSTVLGN